MKRLSLSATVLLAALASGCAQHSILGVWEIEDDGSGQYSFGHYAYLEDGRKCTVLFDYTFLGVETKAYLNRWELDGDVITLTYGPSNSTIEEGYSSSSRIDELTATRLEYTIIRSDYAVGDREVTTRLPNVNPERVCALVNTILLFSPSNNSGE